MKKKKKNIHEIRTAASKKSSWRKTNSLMYRKTEFQSVESYRNACDKGGGW